MVSKLDITGGMGSVCPEPCVLGVRDGVKSSPTSPGYSGYTKGYAAYKHEGTFPRLHVIWE